MMHKPKIRTAHVGTTHVGGLWVFPESKHTALKTLRGTLEQAEKKTRQIKELQLLGMVKIKNVPTHSSKSAFNLITKETQRGVVDEDNSSLPFSN